MTPEGLPVKTKIVTPTKAGVVAAEEANRVIKDRIKNAKKKEPKYIDIKKQFKIGD
jgi:hypothetical protein